MLSTITAAPEPSAGWSAARLLAFRFSLVFWSLFCLTPMVVGVVLPVRWYIARYDRLSHAVIPWFAEHVLRLPTPITVFTNASGDTTFDWVHVLVIALIAVGVAGVWSALDRRRRRHEALQYWFRVVLRYTLFQVLFAYGMAKIFHNQMAPPGVDRMLVTYGESSLQGLLWTFMGSSALYSFFSGAVEVTAATLLLFRRTTLIGALLAAAAMSNVLVLDLAYDVAAKLFAAGIWSMALVLLVPEAGRLWAFFIGGATVSRRAEPRPTYSTAGRYGLVVAKMTVVIMVMYAVLPRVIQRYQARHALRPPLYGYYQVLEPANAGSAMWSQVAISSNTSLFVRRIDGSVATYLAQTPVAHTLRLLGPLPERTVSQVSYDIMGDLLALRGTVENRPVDVRLKRVGDESVFPLKAQRFHWIQEFPNSR